MDDADRAKIYEQNDRAANIKAAKNSRSSEKPIWIEGVPHCCCCTMVIPKERMEAVPNTGRCVGCAEEYEGTK